MRSNAIKYDPIDNRYEDERGCISHRFAVSLTFCTRSLPYFIIFQYCSHPLKSCPRPQAILSPKTVLAPFACRLRCLNCLLLFDLIASPGFLQILASQRVISFPSFGICAAAFQLSDSFWRRTALCEYAAVTEKAPGTLPS